MADYKFSFGYLALKMLGKTLYSNPFAALSELIANGFDAGADKVWVYIDKTDKANTTIVITDNGIGMTDNVVITKYLQVGKKNRPDDNHIMMGRKGIGKLAAFYLSNKYYLYTKTCNEQNVYEIDFTQHENGLKSEEDDSYMRKIMPRAFPEDQIYSACKTGTALYLTNVNLTGYGDKSFSVLESDLAELFKIEDRQILLKIIDDTTTSNKPYIVVSKKIAFKNMAKIYYNTELPPQLLSINGTEIIYSENKDDETKVYVDFERYLDQPREAIVNGKHIKISPLGWIGIHQTIDRKIAHKNDPENFIDSKFYHFNKVRLYIRGKLALDNILPYVHNTQYYVNYIEGEIECNELDSNDLPDIASSSRQDIDKNDDRFIALVEFIKKIVGSLVKYKNDQTKKDLATKRQKQENAVNLLSSDITKTLERKKRTILHQRDIDEINHTILNSFERVNELAKVKYRLFLSHKRNDNNIAEFIYKFLIEKCDVNPDWIFYTSKPGGVDESLEILEKQINNALTDENSYVIFCIESHKFKESEYCMFEGGAAWAVKQNSAIGLVYKDYDKDVPAYLKSMRKIKIDGSDSKLTRDRYINIIKLLNSIIEYLNRNFVQDSKKLKLLPVKLPSETELEHNQKSVEDYYLKDIKTYWSCYVAKK